MTTEKTTTKFGLRAADGRLLRLERRSNAGEDSCGEYTYTLTSGRGSETIKFRVDSRFTLLCAMKESTPWYNSSPTRPEWGNIDPRTCTPVEITVTQTYDDLGGDPISMSSEMSEVYMPKFAPNPSWSYHPGDEVLRKNFGDFAVGYAQHSNVFAAVIDTSETVPDLGEMILTTQQNSGQLWGLIDMPADWKHDRGWFMDFSPSHFKLGLLSTDIRDPYDYLFDVALHISRVESTPDAPRWTPYGELRHETKAAHDEPDYVVWLDQAGEIYNLTNGFTPPSDTSGGYRNLETIVKLKGYSMRDMLMVENDHLTDFKR